jgi:hypothetical protein
MIRDVNSGSRILDLKFFHPGSRGKKAPDPESGSATLFSRPTVVLKECENCEVFFSEIIGSDKVFFTSEIYPKLQKSRLSMCFKQCFGSGLIESGSKIGKNYSWKNFLLIFFIQNAIYLTLGFFKRRPTYRRSLQPSKENF